jgi:hypothetical protein
MIARKGKLERMFTLDIARADARNPS